MNVKPLKVQELWLNLRCEREENEAVLRSKGVGIGSNLRHEGQGIKAYLKCKDSRIKADLGCEGAEIVNYLWCEGEGNGANLKSRDAGIGAFSDTEQEISLI